MRMDSQKILRVWKEFVERKSDDGDKLIGLSSGTHEKLLLMIIGL